jgi:hypothetical protein
MLVAIGWIATDGIEFTRRMARTQPGCPGYLGPARQARRLQPRPPGSPLRQADRAYKAAIADLASQASPGIQPRPVTKRRSRQASVVTRNPS